MKVLEAVLWVEANVARRLASELAPAAAHLAPAVHLSENDQMGARGVILDGLAGPSRQPLLFPLHLPGLPMLLHKHLNTLSDEVQQWNLLLFLLLLSLLLHLLLLKQHCGGLQFGILQLLLFSDLQVPPLPRHR